MHPSPFRAFIALCFAACATQTFAVDNPQITVPLDSKSTALPGSVQSDGWKDKVVVFEANRPNAKIVFFYMKRPGATATIMLMPGGAGGIGFPLVDGKPFGINFLVRTRDFFADAGFNVAVVQRTTDRKEWDSTYRVTDEHMDDLKKIVAYLKADTALPVWMVGTSMGTVSTTAAAIKFGNSELAGIVLTASLLQYKIPEAVPRQDLAAIKIPVLVLHHENDACVLCAPYEVPRVLSSLKNAPVKKLVMAKGGSGQVGDPCDALHYHGFMGMEKEAVGIITDWIKHPSN